MKDLQLLIDDKLCTRCGACAKDCPNNVLIVNKDIPKVSPETADYCIECQHCMAVCPSGALSIFGLNPKDSIPLSPNSLPSPEQMKTFVRGRRSVRQFKNENVSKELLDSLLADLAYAPTGCNARELNFLIVDDKNEMKKLRESVVDMVEEEIKTGKHINEFMVSAVDAFRRDGTDYFFRDAPHLLIVYAGSRAVCGVQDVIISLSYFDLLAQAHGIGTTWCGFLDFAAATAPKIRDVLGIGKDTPFYSMMLGYPAVKYSRTVQRDTSAKIHNFQHD